MKCLLSFCILLLQVIFIFCQNEAKPRILREWRQLDFNFPSMKAFEEATKSGKFVAGNGVPIDVDVDYQAKSERSKIFITIPRFTTGIPITLGTVSTAKNNLVIQPYPDYLWHSSHGSNCDGITSAFRVAIDECHNLWVLDSGKIADNQMCPPTLHVFDLKTDRLIKRYRFPSKDYYQHSLFVTPILDVKDPPPVGRCINTKVYIADVTAFGLIVYDLATDRSWRVQNKLFFPYPNYGTIRIASESFDLMDGILGMTLSPKKTSITTERVLYFHALASGNENSVALSVLNNATMWEADANASPRSFRVLGSRGVQTSAQAMDSNGNLFFVLMEPLAIVCWDSSTTYNQDNIKIVVNNDTTLQFASGLKIVHNRSGQEEIWILTNRFQKIASGTLSTDETNFRIQVALVSDILRGQTKCNGKQLNNFVFPSR